MLRELFFSFYRTLNIDYIFESNKDNELYVLMFHRINDNNLPFYPAMPVSVFDEICRFIAKRFDVILFSEVEGYFKKKNRAAVIFSFDDGYYDLMENAYPVLGRYGLKFNVNVVTESLNTGLPNDGVIIYDILNAASKTEYANSEIFREPVRICIDRRHPRKTEAEFRNLFRSVDAAKRGVLLKDIRQKLSGEGMRFSRMLSKEDLIYLKGHGAQIGSHTHTHPILPLMDEPGIEHELTHSKNILEEAIGQHVEIIAFPQGNSDGAVIKKSREAGYKYLLLTGDRKNVMLNPGQDCFYRINLFHNSLDENLAKIFGFHQMVSNVRTGI